MWWQAGWPPHCPHRWLFICKPWGLQLLACRKQRGLCGRPTCTLDREALGRERGGAPDSPAATLAPLQSILHWAQFTQLQTGVGARPSLARGPHPAPSDISVPPVSPRAGGLSIPTPGLPLHPWLWPHHCPAAAQTSQAVLPQGLHTYCALCPEPAPRTPTCLAPLLPETLSADQNTLQPPF